ncbi:Chaperone protein DnaJ [Linum perenne]
MSILPTLCRPARPHVLFTSLICFRHQRRSSVRVFFKSRDSNPNISSASSSSPSFSPWIHGNDDPMFRANHKRSVAMSASNWNDQMSPYETLELEGDANEEEIKVAFRRLAKFYHPDGWYSPSCPLFLIFYDGRGTLGKGETAEARFIRIQAAYELLMDQAKRKKYDMDTKESPIKASQAWMDWLMKKRKAFDQRGDMAIAAWAEQQQREINLRARKLSRSKIDPDEERRILAREKKASAEYFNTTLKRHTLILKKRDLMRKKEEEDKKQLISQLLAAEGLELDTDTDGK